MIMWSDLPQLDCLDNGQSWRPKTSNKYISDHIAWSTTAREPGQNGLILKTRKTTQNTQKPQVQMCLGLHPSYCYRQWSLVAEWTFIFEESINLSESWTWSWWPCKLLLIISDYANLILFDDSLHIFQFMLLCLQMWFDSELHWNRRSTNESIHLFLCIYYPSDIWYLYLSVLP